METIRGIVEHGRIRLITPHSLPQGAEIEFEPRLVQDKPMSPPIGSNSPELYEVLSHCYDTGDPDLAARHDEHQP